MQALTESEMCMCQSLVWFGIFGVLGIMGFGFEMRLWEVKDVLDSWNRCSLSFHSLFEQILCQTDLTVSNSFIDKPQMTTVGKLLYLAGHSLLKCYRMLSLNNENI